MVTSSKGHWSSHWDGQGDFPSDSWCFCRDQRNDEEECGCHSYTDNEEVEVWRGEGGEQEECFQAPSLINHWLLKMSQHWQERKHQKLQMWWGEQINYSGFQFVSGVIVFPSLLRSAARWSLSSTGPVISVTPADAGSTTVELDPVVDYSGLQVTQDHWTSSKKWWKQAARRSAEDPVPWSRSAWSSQLLLDVPPLARGLKLILSLDIHRCEPNCPVTLH